MSALITFTIPIIRLDFIDKCLETLYKFTDPAKFRVIVVDQTLEGWGGVWAKKVLDHGGKIISQKNGGFAYGANTGLIYGLRWGTPYLGVMNDDLEMIYPTWLEDALEEFKTDERIMAINPMCPKIAMWGYGHTKGEYLEILPYKENYTPQDIEYLKKGDYNEAEIKSRHPYEISKTFPFTQRGVVDAFAGWLPIFKRETLIQIGLYDERFVWGGGEDYDMMGRIYSCAWPIEREICDPKFHGRAVSTMKSWVWHHWGKSKDEPNDPRLFESRESWNRLDLIWIPSSDPWGHTDGKPNKRDSKVYVHIS